MNITLLDIYDNLGDISEETCDLFKDNIMTKRLALLYHNDGIALRMSVSLAIYIYLHNCI